MLWCRSFRQIERPFIPVKSRFHLEVSVDMATLHEFIRDSAHKAQKLSSASEVSFEAMVKLFYENSER